MGESAATLDTLLPWLIEHSSGFSGAEIVSCCQEAAMLSADEGADVVSAAHLMSTVTELRPQMTADMLDFYDRMKASFM